MSDTTLKPQVLYMEYPEEGHPRLGFKHKVFVRDDDFGTYLKFHRTSEVTGVDGTGRFTTSDAVYVPLDVSQ